MQGSKSREERRSSMCVGAKICSGKAKTEDEALAICNAPKLPKWVKPLSAEEEDNASCPVRMTRVVQNIDAISLKVREGEAAEVKGAAAQVLRDIYSCIHDEGVLAYVTDIFEEFNVLTKSFYFKGEGKNVVNNLELVKGVIQA